MSNKAKESIDNMLAEGVTPRDTKGGAVILKGPGARYHQLISTTEKRHDWANTMKPRPDKNCPLVGLTSSSCHIEKELLSISKCGTASRK